MATQDDFSEVSAKSPSERVGIETSEERELRIAKLRKQIANGSYKPDAGQLAAKIVDAHLKRER